MKTGPSPPITIRYEYSYNFNPETAVTKAKKAGTAVGMVATTTGSSSTAAAAAATTAVDDSKSPLNLLSTAASAVVDDEESSSSSSASSSPQVQGIPSPTSSTSTSSSSLASTLLPSKAPSSLALPTLGRSKPPEPRHAIPPAFALPVTAASSFCPVSGAAPTIPPPTTGIATTSRPIAHPVALPPHHPSSNLLAVFPQFSPANYGRAIPMPPGMEITLAPPPPKVATPPTPTPSNPKATAAASAAAGAVAPKAKKAGHHHHPLPHKRYKMKYHYVSMKRSEAYKYIDALARGSGTDYVLYNHPVVPLPVHHPPAVLGSLPPHGRPRATAFSPPKW